MARHGMRIQRDLFAAARAPESLPLPIKQTLLALLEKLLLEATTHETTAREGGDEQDHA
jgi:hypothetical protein